MSSRATSSISKFTRSFSSSPSIARHSSGVNGHKATSGIAPRKQELRAESWHPESQDAAPLRSISTRTKTRPVPNPGRTVPLIQSFRTSAPAPAPVSGPPTIDCTVLPSFSALHGVEAEPLPRVPFLPDNHTPNRSVVGHSRDTPDPPLAAPEILVVAADPSRVAPSALTEVEGMGVDGVELRFVHEPEPEEPEQGMLRDLWSGFVSDVVGDQQNPKPAV